MSAQTKKMTSESGRKFSTFPAAVVAFIISQDEEFLLLRCSRKLGWQVPSGAIEAGESPLQALDRELLEELGQEFTYQLPGLVDASSVRLDAKIALLSIGYLLLHLGTEIAPGDDMAGAEVSWMSLEKILQLDDITVPRDTATFTEALRLFRLLKA